MRVFFTFFLCFVTVFSAVAQNSKRNRISTDDRVSKFGRHADEYLLTTGLQGGMNLGEDIGTTNPFFAGFNLEFERVFKKCWSLGVKISPRINIGTSESVTYTIPSLVPGIPSYTYTQDYDYSTFYAIPIFVTGKYYFRPYFVRPYIGLDLGMSILLGKTDGAEFLNTSSKSLEVNTVFGVTPQFGVIFDITESLHWGVKLYCSVFTGSEVNGNEITYVGLAAEDNNLFVTPEWTNSTRRLNPTLSAGLEVSLVFSF